MMVTLLMACSDDPGISSTPQIEFKSISFAQGTTSDTIRVTISFIDGNMDLGLSENDTDNPFHENFYLIATGQGELSEVPTFKKYKDLPPFIQMEDKLNGKLTSIRSRKNPEYATLPPYSCKYYSKKDVYISEEDGAIIDNSYYIIDTLKAANTPDAYVLRDSIYFKPNPNHYNFDVKFKVKNADGTFSDFDWMEAICTTFNARFPLLTNAKPGDVVKGGNFIINMATTTDGTLTYTMSSQHFRTFLAGEVIKIEIKIRDRTINQSNTVQSTEIQL